MIAYSSMAQMSLIVLGIFAAQRLRAHGSGAPLRQPRPRLCRDVPARGNADPAHGHGPFADLGGLAKGRPALATSVLIVGMLTLAVPGSANFAGEFAILAGVFRKGWGYAAVGAVAIVLAAMYSLRLISAVLHRGTGSGRA